MAGCAGGVDNVRQIVDGRLTAQIRLAGECTRGIEIAVIATGGFGFANPDDFIDFGFGFDVFEFFGQRRGCEHKACAAVIEDVGKFFAFQKDVEWDGYRADGSNGEIGGNKFGRVGNDKGNPVAILYAFVLQIGGDGFYFAFEGGIADFFFVVENDCAFTVFLAGCSQHSVKIRVGVHFGVCVHIVSIDVRFR